MWDGESMGAGARKEGWFGQMVKGWRGEVRQVVGFGEGRVMSWGRKAVSTYTHLRTKKGALRGWKYKIGKDDSPQCRHCGEGEETGDHLMFTCGKWKDLREEVWIKEEAGSRSWRSWEDIDS